MTYTTKFKQKVLLKYENGQSQMAIEKECGVSRPTILKWLKEAGIKEHWYKAKYLDKDTIIKMYQDGLSVLKIADEMGIGRRPVESILKQNNIEKRDNSQALIGRYGGSLNGNYKGGNARDFLYDEEPCLPRILQLWASIILSLDSFQCQMCSMTQVRLEANHIISCRKIYRENLDRSLIIDINNGITLCEKCHASIHMREHEFEEQFKKLIKNRVNSVETLMQSQAQDFINSTLRQYRAKRKSK